jgi:hypothetical protein
MLFVTAKRQFAVGPSASVYFLAEDLFGLPLKKGREPPRFASTERCEAVKSEAQRLRAELDSLYRRDQVRSWRMDCGMGGRPLGFLTREVV